MPKGRILICDDDPSILRLLQVNLELEDYEVLSGRDGQEGYDIAVAEHPDLVILDIMMPNLDGYGACKKLKANPEVADIPVLFLSAKAQEEDMQEGLDLGAAAYLTKPFDPEDLSDTIERLIGE